MPDQPVASVASAPGAIDGNENNSSPDFQILDLPASGNLTVQISGHPNSDSITFVLWRDINNRQDEKVVETALSNNATISVSKVAVGDNYYIGDPKNAGNQNFVVTLLANFG